jgi:electron transfer flavoprotein alpha subunit
MMAGILVFCEQRDGKIKRAGLEALGAAQGLRAQGGGPDEVVAVLIGGGDAPFSCADRVYRVEAPPLYSSEGYATVMADLAKRLSPAVILMGATAMGKDLGPKLAARLQAPFFGDCTALALGETGLLTATRPIYAGKVIAKVVSRQTTLQVATLRPNAFPALAEGPKAVVVPDTPAFDFAQVLARVKAVQATVGGKIELTEARIIVSGGRGLRGPENFHLVESLAEALGAAVGASRAAVDAGWKPHSYQVGLTGKTVSPLLYIACGISGAVQHLAGMSSAKYIVAINKDPNAPIFKLAHHGIVGDLFEVLPLLTAAIRSHAEPAG